MGTTLNDESDAHLLERCFSGLDKDAWKIFVRQYSPLVWASIRKTFYSLHYQYIPEDIEDVYGTVFLSLVDDNFRRLKLFKRKNACTLKTWLTVIGVRTTIDYLRRQKRHYSVDRGEEGPEAWQSIHEKALAPEEIIVEKEREVMLRRAIDSLPPRDQAIYHLLIENETPPEEVAAITGLSITAIYSRKTRIIGKLRKTMKVMQEKR